MTGRKYVKGHKPRKLTKQGYVRVYRPDCPVAHKTGMIMEHRWVVWSADIEVPPGYAVHHRNGVKHDNRLENLEVIALDEHTRRHMHEVGAITNQYGTFPIVTDQEARRQRYREQLRRDECRRRERRQARAAA